MKRSHVAWSIAIPMFLLAIGCSTTTPKIPDTTQGKPPDEIRPTDQTAHGVDNESPEHAKLTEALVVVEEKMAPRERETSRDMAPGRVQRNKSLSKKMLRAFGPSNKGRSLSMQMVESCVPPVPRPEHQMQFNTEAYDFIEENRFVRVLDKPLSTFSIDVDAASYSNIRRFLKNSQLPPKDAVRIEEMINYFTYDYPQPTGKHPFSITGEVGGCPWNENHKLVHIGLQGKKVATEQLPASNLVFLLDVSGSMNSPNKLPLLKKALTMLTENLRPEDRVAIVVYAGAAGQVLESTPGNRKREIIGALANLSAGGSTAGGAGIQLAYKVAAENLIPKGNNRVILATDGDFNVGASSDGELVRMIEKKRNQGIFLTVLGFGTGNYKDSKMEQLADKGNGNYAYIDDILEAKKVLVTEMGGTLLTIAKDVKLQVEFNPSKVAAYRLIGYENRKLRDQEFNDDTKDAGELGAGHSVTALYEIIPQGVPVDNLPGVDPLKYQKRSEDQNSSESNELMTVKFRYKRPDENASNLIVAVVNDTRSDEISRNLGFSAAAAGFGMLLRDSKFKGDLSYDQVKKMAQAYRGDDDHGYRSEFIRLVERADALAGSRVSSR